MSVYKIFPQQDATIYSSNPSANAGIDEILEISSVNSNPNLGIISGLDDIRRTLIKFSDADISTIAGFATGSFTVGLKLYLAYASTLPQTYTILCNPVGQAWTMGTGKINDIPNPKNGVCWISVGAYSQSAIWSNTYGTSSYLYTVGGGVWNPAYSASQSFGYTDNKDVNIDVTTMVSASMVGTIPNYGLLLRITGSIELNPSSSIETQFFSMDTHTVYPPCLEMKWDDSVYNTGSNTNGTIIAEDFVLIPQNNTDKLKVGNVYRMKFVTRDRYPARTFATGSDYLNWRYLPQQSYWSIVDYKTSDVIVDFDTNYTKLSADTNSNYFTLYTNGLQPERSYRILIKTIVPSTGEQVIVDNGVIFKVTR